MVTEMGAKRYLNQLIFQMAMGVMASNDEEPALVASTAHWSMENCARSAEAREIETLWVAFVDDLTERGVFS